MRRWLIYSNLHIVPVAAGFVLGTYALAGVPVDVAYVVLATCGAFLVYQWDRISGLSPEDQINVPERRQWLLDRPVYLILSSLAAVTGAIWGLTVSSGLVRISAILLGMVGAGYAVPLLLGRRPKDISRFKNILIAGCWLGGGIVLPLLDTASAGVMFIIWLCVYRLAYILPDLTLADSVDRPGDAAVGLEHGLSGHALQPTGIATAAGVTAAGLAIVFLTAGWSIGRLPPETTAIVLLVDLLGLVGTRATVRRVQKFEYRHVIMLDGWVAFPLVTWMVSRILQSGL